MLSSSISAEDEHATANLRSKQIVDLFDELSQVAQTFVTEFQFERIEANIQVDVDQSLMVIKTDINMLRALVFYTLQRALRRHGVQYCRSVYGHFNPCWDITFRASLSREICTGKRKRFADGRYFVSDLIDCSMMSSTIEGVSCPSSFAEGINNA